MCEKQIAWKFKLHQSMAATAPFCAIMDCGFTGVNTFTRMAIRAANWLLHDEYGVNLNYNQRVGNEPFYSLL